MRWTTTLFAAWTLLLFGCLPELEGALCATDEACGEGLYCNQGTCARVAVAVDRGLDPGIDGGALDGAAPPPDAEPPDLAPPVDASRPDAARLDMAQPDAARLDLAQPDAAPVDLAQPDAAQPDLAPVDLAQPDLAPVDLAQPDLAPVDMAPVDLAQPDLALSDMAQPDMAPVDMAPVDMAPVDMAPVDMAPVDMAQPDLAQPDMAPVDMAPVDMAQTDMATPCHPASDPRACEPADGPCPGALQRCVDGAWGPCVVPVEVCDDLDNDCDGMTDEDFDLDTDPDHCGGCHDVCSFANAQPVCSAGQCRLDACNPGFWDADKDVSNGCEYRCDLRNGGIELCDGFDDDCDGTTDEALFATCACVDDPTGAGLPLCEPACTPGFADLDGVFGCERGCEQTGGTETFPDPVGATLVQAEARGGWGALPALSGERGHDPRGADFNQRRVMVAVPQQPRPDQHGRVLLQWPNVQGAPPLSIQLPLPPGLPEIGFDGGQEASGVTFDQLSVLVRLGPTVQVPRIWFVAARMRSKAAETPARVVVWRVFLTPDGATRSVNVWASPANGLGDLSRPVLFADDPLPPTQVRLAVLEAGSGRDVGHRLVLVNPNGLDGQVDVFWSESEFLRTDGPFDVRRLGPTVVVAGQQIPQGGLGAATLVVSHISGAGDVTVAVPLPGAASLPPNAPLRILPPTSTDAATPALLAISTVSSEPGERSTHQWLRGGGFVPSAHLNDAQVVRTVEVERLPQVVFWRTPEQGTGNRDSRVAAAASADPRVPDWQLDRGACRIELPEASGADPVGGASSAAFAPMPFAPDCGAVLDAIQNPSLGRVWLLYISTAGTLRSTEVRCN